MFSARSNKTHSSSGFLPGVQLRAQRFVDASRDMELFAFDTSGSPSTNSSPVPVEGLKVFPSSEEAAAALANFTTTAADKAIASRGSFTVALAGGSLVKMLQGIKSVAGVEWDKWHVFWVDERCVPHNEFASDPESNYAGAEAALLKDVPIPKSQIYAIDESLCQTADSSAAEAAKEYETRLKGLPSDVLPIEDGLPVFDLLLLGFGPDGHICSLFPGHPLLKVEGPWILSIEDSPKPPPKRITFSLPVVNAADQKCFVACG
eukprot:gene34523-biopygen32572